MLIPTGLGKRKWGWLVPGLLRPACSQRPRPVSPAAGCPLPHQRQHGTPGQVTLGTAAASTGGRWHCRRFSQVRRPRCAGFPNLLAPQPTSYSETPLRPFSTIFISQRTDKVLKLSRHTMGGSLTMRTAMCTPLNDLPSTLVAQL